MRNFQYGIKTGVNLKLASNCLTSENKKPYLVCSLQETFAGGVLGEDGGEWLGQCL